MDWFTSTEALLGVVATGIGIVVFLFSLSPVIRKVIATRIFFSRARLMGAVRRASQAPRAQGSRVVSRRKIWASTWKRASNLARGRTVGVAHELDWLKRVLGCSTTLAFADFPVESLREMADGYSSSANLLRIRTAISGGDQPLLGLAADLAGSVSIILRKQASMIAVADRSEDASVAAVERVLSNVSYVSEQNGVDKSLPSHIEILRLAAKSRAIDYGLRVSWELESVEQTAGFGREAGAREYDGLLPRLRRFRFERDSSNGNYRLHVELGNIWYSEHREINSPEVRNNQRPAQFRCADWLESNDGSEINRLLTLSTLPVTTDGFFIVAKRGQIGMYPDCWGPGAGGNLEIPRDEADVDDLDEEGIISPTLALAREAREELGLQLSVDQLHPVGLIRVSTSEETGTWVLGYIALTGLTTAGLRESMRSADPIAGLWELGEHIAAIPIPATKTDAERLARWATSSPDVMPHLAAQVLLLCAGLRGGVSAPPRRRTLFRRGELPPGSKILPVGIGAGSWV